MAAASDAPARPQTLRAERLSKRYGERWALRELTFAAAAGEMVAIIGPNGAGKTTLLQILSGALEPSGGTIAAQPERIGWVPQQPAVYSKLSVRENLRLFARLEKVADVDATVERMLDQTGLHERSSDEVGKLSGGNRQRLNIAIGVLSEPAVLLLDEPSASLDPRQREVMWEFVGGLAAHGTTVVYSTHDVAEADRHADRLLVLADGELLFDGPARELRGDAPDAELETAFVGFLRERGH